MDIQAMLAKGFDRSLAGLDIVRVGNGHAEARLFVSESVQNFFGKLHGGAIATLVDDVGTFAIMSADHFRRPGVTTDLHVSCMNAGLSGESVLIKANVVSCGLTLAFAEVTLTSESRGVAIARGQMTKLLGSAPADKAQIGGAP
jgi:acyl-coenzyme A thioesterase 13